MARLPGEIGTEQAGQLLAQRPVAAYMFYTKGQAVTHRFPLERVQDAFDAFAERRDGAVKVILDFSA